MKAKFYYRSANGVGYVRHTFSTSKQLNHMRQLEVIDQFLVGDLQEDKCSQEIPQNIL